MSGVQSESDPNMKIMVNNKILLRALELSRSKHFLKEYIYFFNAFIQQTKLSKSYFETKPTIAIVIPSKMNFLFPSTEQLITGPTDPLR